MTQTVSRKLLAWSVERDRDLYQAQLDIFLDPNDPEVIKQAQIDGIPDNWMDAMRVRSAPTAKYRTCRNCASLCSTWPTC